MFLEVSKKFRNFFRPKNFRVSKIKFWIWVTLGFGSRLKTQPKYLSDPRVKIWNNTIKEDTIKDTIKLN